MSSLNLALEDNLSSELVRDYGPSNSLIQVHLKTRGQTEVVLKNQRLMRCLGSSEKERHVLV